jgi:hypothetical protein
VRAALALSISISLPHARSQHTALSKAVSLCSITLSSKLDFCLFPFVCLLDWRYAGCVQVNNNADVVCDTDVYRNGTTWNCLFGQLHNSENDRRHWFLTEQNGPLTSFTAACKRCFRPYCDFIFHTALFHKLYKIQ